MDIKLVLDGIASEAAQGGIVFPTHAEIALRVQRMLDDPDCAIDALGKLISAEPLLVSRILGIANSVAFNPGGRAITDLKNAISRLGFATVRALSASIVVRQMQEMPTTETHRKLSAKLWEHTASVASLARILAKRVTRQNPEDAFFAGIVHEVGSFYLISRANAYPGLFENSLESWHEESESIVGQAVLNALGVPDRIVMAIQTLWSGFLAMPPETLGDTLLLADELTPIESPIDTLTGMSRKGMKVELEMLVDNETLSDILEESADEVASLSAALRG